MPDNNILNITIPGRPSLRLQHLILDYNGTIAYDGLLLPELIPQLNTLAQHLTIHVLTADTHGSAARQIEAFPCHLAVIPSGEQIIAKQRYLQQLTPEHCVAIGNGVNDQLLLRDAALGIAVMQQEGVAIPSLLAADIVIGSCSAALDLLLNPKLLIATLRC
ncbi:MAG: ATPase P [Thermodesulfobacteriota bacterium]|nr:ATPase P [Thermodesulfobacteriota bacterium]